MYLLEKIINEECKIKNLGYDMYEIIFKDKSIIVSVKEEPRHGIKETKYYDIT